MTRSQTVMSQDPAPISMRIREPLKASDPAWPRSRRMPANWCPKLKTLQLPATGTQVRKPASLVMFHSDFYRSSLPACTAWLSPCSYRAPQLTLPAKTCEARGPDPRLSAARRRIPKHLNRRGLRQTQWAVTSLDSPPISDRQAFHGHALRGKRLKRRHNKH